MTAVCVLGIYVEIRRGFVCDDSCTETGGMVCMCVCVQARRAALSASYRDLDASVPTWWSGTDGTRSQQLNR